MRHLKLFGSSYSSADHFKESSSGEYYHILDIRDSLGSLSPGAEDYYQVSIEDKGLDLDYSEHYDELKFEPVFSEDKNDYEMEMDTSAIFDDMFASLKASEESPFFTEDEIYQAIEDAIVKSNNGADFVYSIDASDCSVDWHVRRGSSSYREFRVEASLNGTPRVSKCDWGSFVESVMKELGSRTAGRIDYA